MDVRALGSFQCSAVTWNSIQFNSIMCFYSSRVGGQQRNFNLSNRAQEEQVDAMVRFQVDAKLFSFFLSFPVGSLLDAVQVCQVR